MKKKMGAAPKEPNYQFKCLLSPANEIGQRNQEKAAGILVSPEFTSSTLALYMG